MSLLEVDPSALSPEDAVLFLQEFERHLAWLHAVQVRALVAAAGPEQVTWEVILGGPDPLNRDPDPGIDEILREEVASATRWGSGHAQGRIDVARLLSGNLPQVLEALDRGAISYAHAAAIANAAEALPGYGDSELKATFAEACTVLQEYVLPTALSSNVTRTRRAAARAAAEIADLDPPHRRRQQQLAQSVSVIDDADGLSTLMARMPAHHAHACMAAIRQLADSPMLDLPCDASVGQRRALALATLVIGPHPSSADDPVAPRPRTHLDIVIGLDALLNLSSQAGTIVGAGHVPADVVRGLLADATMRRMVTDPLSGHLLDLGRRTYRVPDALRHFIEARDQVCRFPGCGRRAINCEIDHATPWSQDGQTSPENLGALCVRHHRMKTHAGWKISDSDPTGGCTWTSPFGHVYRHRPPPPLPEPIPGRCRSTALSPPTKPNVREPESNVLEPDVPESNVPEPDVPEPEPPVPY